MALTKRISRVGNSAGVTFDQPILKQLGWQLGTSVQFKVKGSQLILSPSRTATDEEATEAGKKVVNERRELIERLASR